MKSISHMRIGCLMTLLLLLFAVSVCLPSVAAQAQEAQSQGAQEAQSQDAHSASANPESAKSQGAQPQDAQETQSQDAQPESAQSESAQPQDAQPQDTQSESAQPEGAQPQDVQSQATQDAKQKVVRVGWYESPFNTTDQFGRRSGYAYEYQRKIAAYTGWTYEYVEGRWASLVQMLKDGKIDLMSDVSYLEDRTKDMLFASLPMGTEAYYVFVSPSNKEITSADFSSLDGKRVGVTKDTVQEDMFLDWAKKHDLDVELVELTGLDSESIRLLRKGTIDAYVTLDVYADSAAAVPICKIGSSDFFFVVNKDRPDLLNDLDVAMNKIQDENRFYNQQLHEEYLRSEGPSLYLSADEQAWLEKHGAIRVGYQDNYLAFCAEDPRTGELTGALKDYLAAAVSSSDNAHLSFQAVSYPTAAAAMDALKNGEVDCMFPANLTAYDAESLDVVMSPPIMRSEMDAVVRASDQKEFIRKKDVKVAVNQGNTNYEMFLADHYPGWEPVHYPDTPEGLKAVAAGDADCVIISNYRFSNIHKQCEALHLTTVYTGVDMNYYFALREGDTQLYAILAKITDVVPDSITNAALTYYSTEDVKTSFADLVKDNLFVVLSVIAAVLLVILLLLLRSIRAEKKVREEEHLVKDLNKRVYVDALTSIRNKGAYDDYIQSLQDAINGGDCPEFAIGVFDCDDLKAINDQHGHDKGDEYLKAASSLICRIFAHSPVFRIGGDEFAAVLQNEDFQNRDGLVAEFNRAQDEETAAAKHPWEEVRVALGIAVYDPQGDPSVSDTARRADKVMYENKRMRKSAR